MFYFMQRSGTKLTPINERERFHMRKSKSLENLKFALGMVAGKTLAYQVPKKYAYICLDNMGKTKNQFDNNF